METESTGQAAEAGAEAEMRTDEQTADKGVEDAPMEAVNGPQNEEQALLPTNVMLLRVDDCDQTTRSEENLGIDMEKQKLSLGTLVIEAKDMRYAGLCNIGSSVTNLIVISYNVPSESGMESCQYLFFQKADAENLQGILNAIQNLIREKLKPVGLEPEDSHYGTGILDQPIFAGWLDLYVEDTDSTVDTSKPVSRYFVVLDVETMALFKNGPNIKPDFLVRFWEKVGTNVVEKILFNHEIDILVFETTIKKYAVTKAKERSDFIGLLKQLRPKPKNLLADPEKLAAYRKRLEEAEKNERPFGIGGPPPGWATRPKRIQGTEDWDTEIEEQRQNRTEAEIQAELEQRRQLEEQRKQLEAAAVITSAVDQIHSQLNNAVERFKGNEDFEALWVACQADLEELLEAGTIPKTDARSGGLDPDNPEHLKKTLEDIEGQLQEQQYQVAMSRLSACRDIFKKSKELAIRSMFLDDEDPHCLELMRKLFYKSYCS